MAKHNEKTNAPFTGFPQGAYASMPIPPGFMQEFLPQVTDVNVLRVLLFCFYALPQKEGEFRYLRRADFANDDALMHGLAAASDTDAQVALGAALDAVVAQGALLHAEVDGQGLYFVNTEKGRAALAQVQSGNWTLDAASNVEILPERPNIYRLYEQNIGALTPMISDDLKDLEKSYSAQWIHDAFHEAVKSNKRSLRYVQAVLKRWRDEGRAGDRQGADADADDGKKYVSGKFADFLNH